MYPGLVERKPQNQAVVEGDPSHATDPLEDPSSIQVPAEPAWMGSIVMQGAP